MDSLKENKMGVRPVGRLLFAMALPMALSMLVQALYNVVDSAFVAKIHFSICIFQDKVIFIYILMRIKKTARSAATGLRTVQ